MEQPKMPMLTLDLQKTTTYNTIPLRLTQGDKGYIQPFTLTNSFQQYTVTADVLGFRAMKPDRTFIEIENEPERFSNVDGVWQFTLPDELTQSVGTVSGAYFLVTNGSTVVASTTKFNYSIGASWSSDEESNNYVTKFEELGKKLQDYVNAGAQTITVLSDYGEEARTNLSDSLASLTSEVTAWKAKTASDIDATLASKKVALDKLQTDFTAKYNAIVAQYNTVTAEWTTKKSDYDKEFTASQTAKQTAFDTQTDTNQTSFDKQLADNQSAFDAEIAKIDTEKTTALDKIASDATAKIANIQSQADAKLASIQKDWNTLKPKLQAEINALSTKVSGIDDQSNSIKTRLDELVAQLDDIDIASVKNTADKATADVATLTASLATKADKTEVESEITSAKTAMATDAQNVATKALSDSKAYTDTATSGVVKHVSVNGGELVAPDTAGNLALTVPDPDLTSYAQKTDLTDYATQSSLSAYAKTADVTTGVNSAKEYTDQQLAGSPKSWIGTLSEYQALGSYDDLTTYYVISGYEVIVK